MLRKVQLQNGLLREGLSFLSQWILDISCQRIRGGS